MVDVDLEPNVCILDDVDHAAVRQAQSQALPGRTIECLSRLFSSLSDPTRIRILHSLMLTDELCVCDLAAIVDLSVSAVSHQLRLLRDRNLVKARRDGRMVYYSLLDANVTELMTSGIDQACRP
jgi:DNA-binding transcriptional ArsR family regulator